MAKAKKAGSVKEANGEASKALFPYTTKPGSLRKVLQLIPKKPRPPKFDMQLLKSWGFPDTNDASVLRVLKAVKLLDGTGVPTETYTQFMNIQGGASAIAPNVRSLYQPLFTASHTPYSESQEILTNLFNIHSGGGERSIEYQIQTFKALCENTTFSGADPINPVNPATTTTTQNPTANAAAQLASGNAPPVHINLHIHLPENKSRRDYEAMIEDIGRFIFGKTGGGGEQQ